MLLNKLLARLGFVVTCLLGQGLAGAQAPQQAASGPFTLQVVEKKSGLQFSANHGFHRIDYQMLRLVHNGRAVAVPDGHGGSRTELRDAWLLADAPRPAVLVGGDTWVLVTERDGRPHLETLVADGRGSLQWTDMPGGPGPVHVSRTRVEPVPLTLQGGRRLLLDRGTVLDVQTLRWQPLSLDLPPGYSVSETGLLGASPDGRALAFLLRGESNSARDAAIVVTATDRRAQEVLALDLKPYTGLDHIAAPADLLVQHFRWQLQGQGDALPRLQPLAPARDATWTSDYRFGLRAARVNGTPVPSYTLSPVLPAMLAAAREQVIAQCGGQPAPAVAGDPPADRHARLKLWVVPVLMRFDAGARALVVESEHPESPLWAQQMVRCIGEQLDSQLAAGALQAQLAPDARAGHRR